MNYRKYLAFYAIIMFISACDKEAIQEEKEIEYENISIEVYNQNSGVSNLHFNGMDYQTATEGEQRILTSAFNYETTDNVDDAIGHAKVSFTMTIPPFFWIVGRYINVKSEIEITAYEGDYLAVGAVLDPMDIVDVDRDKIIRNKLLSKLTIINSTTSNVEWYQETIEDFEMDGVGEIELFYPLMRRSMQKLLEGRKHSILVVDQNNNERAVQTISEVNFYTDKTMTVISEHLISEVNLSAPVSNYAIYKIGLAQNKIFFGKP
ncbi:hypothetical protein [Carboxylicivirga caseinilyticus]|uniref:hypothetical protein n=1 Tax=Carboxylicivirga caseinilyticus TaxID=3417572 RepID=UPI003D359399|nr:hypothetical protein [Marinilabiliaceae bacterium A049]